MSAIKAFAFYLRQSFLPVMIAPAYPLRAVVADGSALTEVAFPAIVVALSVAAAMVISKRSALAAFACVVFAVSLAPALKVNVFLPDHIVHDRYLYLPVLGPVLVGGVAAAAGLRRFRLSPAVRRALGIGSVLVVVAALTLMSRAAAFCWTSDLHLWRCSVASDPESAYNRAQLAEILLRSGHPKEALIEANRALEIEPATTALLVRAEVLTAEGRAEEAVTDLRAIVERFPNHFAAWERLAVAYQALGELEGAESVLRIARDRVPWRVCSLTANLAVILVLEDRPAEALAELRTVLDSTENTSLCRMAPYFAARLELRRGQSEEAGVLLNDFLVRSEGDNDVDTQTHRRETQRLLKLIP